MPSTYQLHITLTKDSHLRIGKLGEALFPAGSYVYTGSAKQNLEARIKRHRSKKKKLRWHIDYLLASRNAEITDVKYFEGEECEINKKTQGGIPLKGFGSSDCRKGCGSHLKKVTGKRILAGM